MTNLLTVLILALSLPTFAITTKATQEVFEALVYAADPKAVIKAPMSVEANNVICTRGAKKVVACWADFITDGTTTNKEIKNSQKFFKYLDHHNGITLDEMMLGENRYKAEKIVCTYDAQTNPYYRCVSELSVKF